MSSSSEDQLVSFFLYSFIIYPVTGYLVSPKRKYARWKGALFAILLLVTIALAHSVYENSEKGPNFYQMLRVTRSTSVSAVKKTFRNLSLELHPDKNKSPDAEENFLKLKSAYDTITNAESRRAYNLAGLTSTGSQPANVDVKYIALHMIVFYGTSLVYAFFMTFSEPNGKSFVLSVYGLSVLLLIECLLVLEEWELPNWFFPSYTSYEMLALLHRLFPVFINCTRVVTEAFHVDRRVDTAQRLHGIWQSLNGNINLSVSLIERIKSNKVSNIEISNSAAQKGLMAIALEKAVKSLKMSHITFQPNIDHKPPVSLSRNFRFFIALVLYIIGSYIYARWNMNE